MEKHYDWQEFRELYNEPREPKQPLPKHDMDSLRQNGITFIKAIAAGGSAQIWTAERELSEDGRTVREVLACKIMSIKPYGHMSVTSALDLIYNEARVLERLHHPHCVGAHIVIRLYDRHHQYDCPVRVLMFSELCGGDIVDLIHHLKLSRLTESQCLGWFVQIAEAVRYLHKELNIAHLDIKPENILFKTNPQNPNEYIFKLTDFGMAIELSAGQTPTSIKYGGTSDYIPPEVETCSVIKRAYDIYKADIYSLGITLARLMVGFEKQSMFSVFFTPPLEQMLTDIKHWSPRVAQKWAISAQMTDLIVNMTLVDINHRFSVDDVVGHAWTRLRPYAPNQWFTL